MPFFGLQYMSVVFPDHTHLLCLSDTTKARSCFVSALLGNHTRNMSNGNIYVVRQFRNNLNYKFRSVTAYAGIPRREV